MIVIVIVIVRNNKMLTSRHKKAPESFDSEALDHDYYIWVKLGAYEKSSQYSFVPRII